MRRSSCMPPRTARRANGGGAAILPGRGGTHVRPAPTCRLHAWAAATLHECWSLLDSGAHVAWRKRATPGFIRRVPARVPTAVGGFSARPALRPPCHVTPVPGLAPASPCHGTLVPGPRACQVLFAYQGLAHVVWPSEGAARAADDHHHPSAGDRPRLPAAQEPGARAVASRSPSARRTSSTPRPPRSAARRRCCWTSTRWGWCAGRRDSGRLRPGAVRQRPALRRLVVPQRGHRRGLRHGLGGRSKERPELAEPPLPLEATLDVRGLPRRRRLLRRLFEPLGYTVARDGLPARSDASRMGREPLLHPDPARRAAGCATCSPTSTC